MCAGCKPAERHLKRRKKPEPEVCDADEAGLTDFEQALVCNFPFVPKVNVIAPAAVTDVVQVAEELCRAR